MDYADLAISRDECGRRLRGALRALEESRAEVKHLRGMIPMSRDNPTLTFADYAKVNACMKCGRTWAKSITKLPDCPVGCCTCGGRLIDIDTPIMTLCARQRSEISRLKADLATLKAVVNR